MEINFLSFQASKYAQINRELQTRLQQYELAYSQLRCDNLLMQEELQRLGVMVPDLLTKKKYNGRYTPSKLPSSPQGSPNGGGHRINMLSQKHSIKKERDT